MSLSLKLRVFVLTVICAQGSVALAENPYQTLGVSPSASVAEIKQAYRVLIMRYHPDQNQGDAAAVEKFRKVQEAYELLTRPPSQVQRDKKFWERTEEDDVRDNVEWIKKNNQRSNDRWVFEAESRRFYDNRLKKWLLPELRGAAMPGPFFRSEEGWQFDPDYGTYYSVDIDAKLNPDDGRGWTRRLSNTDDSYLQIDPLTGFSIESNYRPKTLSDASALFDEILNPAHVLRSKKDPSQRNAQLEKLDALEWTPSQTSDYRERVREHIRIFQRKDMAPRLASNAMYAESILQAIMEPAVIKSHPDLVVELIRDFPTWASKTMTKDYLVRDSWLTHPNSPIWLREVFRSTQSVFPYTFIDQLFNSTKSTGTAILKFEHVYPAMLEGAPAPRALRRMINWIHFNKSFESFKTILANLVELPGFSEMVSTVDTDAEDRAGIVEVLMALAQNGSTHATVYLETLEQIPGVIKNSNRYNGLRGFNSEIYDADVKKIATTRMQFIAERIPRGQASPIENAIKGNGPISEGNCSKLLFVRRNGFH